MENCAIAFWIARSASHHPARLKQKDKGETHDQATSHPRTERASRRPAHDTRPEEIRAENAIYDSDKKLKGGHFDELILELAIEIEKVKKQDPR